MAALTDHCPMPWGKHKGKAMVNVPAGYLLYLHREKLIKDLRVAKYVKDNMNALQLEENNRDKPSSNERYNID